jgi:Adenylate and Guanylate cyclase catalytic domain
MKHPAVAFYQRKTATPTHSLTKREQPQLRPGSQKVAQNVSRRCNTKKKMIFPASVQEDAFLYKGDDSRSGNSEASADDTTNKYEERHPDHETSKQSQDSPEEIVRRETQFISLFRCLLILALLLAAAVAITFVYLFTSKSEQEKFRAGYDALSATLLSSLFMDMRLNFMIAHTISRSLSLSIAMAEKPVTNFTMPRPLWEGVTEEARWIADDIAVSWIPFLFSDEERATFEAHVVAKYGNASSETGAYAQCDVCNSDADLIVSDESVSVAFGGMEFTCGEAYHAGRTGRFPETHCPIVTEAIKNGCTCEKRSDSSSESASGKAFGRSYDEGIYRFSDDGTTVDQEFGQAPYAPMYSVSSLNLKRLPTLFDAFSDPFRRRALNAAVKKGASSLSEMRLRTEPYYEYTDFRLGEATADLYYPVFSYDSATPRVVGAVGVEFLWSRFITGAVPPLSHLVTVVIENTCGQEYSFAIDQQTTHLVLQGTEDRHESKYTDWARSTSYEAYANLVSFSGGLNDDEFCSYKFRLHPTEELENMYYTKAPLHYAAITGAIFIFTSIVFLVYDFMVRRRQAKVMASAKRTNNIVTSLFPDTVRQRLFDRQEAVDLERQGLDTLPFHQVQDSKSIVSASVFGTDPITDYFSDTTVMFLDIVGFTGWSAHREPSQTFTLLENIYHAFDEAARRLGVFKIETIGDCYVAVAGLPTPRSDHAVGMCSDN